MLVTLLLVVLCAACDANAGYVFFRYIKGPAGARRLFGSTEERAGGFPRACALLDRGMAPSCSCAVLAPRWALTAAHCARPLVHHVQYNGLELADSDIQTVEALYQHPEFQAVTAGKDELSDVVMLHHDVGLVRTDGDMLLRVDESWLRSQPDPLADLAKYDVSQLNGQEVDVLGFGMTDARGGGRSLRRARLLLMGCDREGWRHCACAVGNARGVCAGDSGGPVLYNGTQIGVTSLGPTSCGGLAAMTLPLARSVLTALAPYAGVIHATVHDTPDVLRMRRVRSGRSDGVHLSVGVVLLCAGVWLCTFIIR